jgi:organic radical activating enzyme|tara:strand:+ start:1182 stop:2309 length:1128 start_codon:yes stop_codon:yes gene_type:complete
MKDVWCSLPWTHICVRPDDTLKPCCRYQYASGETKHSASMDSIATQGVAALNNEYLNQLRSDLLAGVARDECKKCYVEEKNHRASYRNNMNTVINLKPEDCNDRFDSVQYLELSIDNICNLQCRMCDSKFSSRLIGRDQFLGNPVHKKLEPSYEKLRSLDLSKLTRIKLLGGEPFITPNFERFLDFIAEQVDVSQVYLDINTNATVIPNDKIVYKLNQFKFLEFNVSLDSYSSSNNYQRWGGDYQQSFNNVLVYEKIFKKKYIAYHTTISTLTANDLAHTLNILTGLHNYHVSIDFVRSPEHLCMLYAPPEYVKWVLAANESNTTAYSVTSNFLKDAVYDVAIWQQFIETTAKLDNYYNIKLADYNPALAEFLAR